MCVCEHKAKIKSSHREENTITIYYRNSVLYASYKSEGWHSAFLPGSLRHFQQHHWTFRSKAHSRSQSVPGIFEHSQRWGRTSQRPALSDLISSPPALQAAGLSFTLYPLPGTFLPPPSFQGLHLLAFYVPSTLQPVSKVFRKEFLNWGIIDIQHYIHLRCTPRWFENCIHCKMVTVINLVNICHHIESCDETF